MVCAGYTFHGYKEKDNATIIVVVYEAKCLKNYLKWIRIAAQTVYYMWGEFD